MQNLQSWRKVTAHVSLRGLRRLTWVETFADALSPLYTEHNSYSVYTNIVYEAVEEKNAINCIIDLPLFSCTIFKTYLLRRIL